MSKVKSINIRMYRHGLGDCFLLTMKCQDDKKYHILIDCGVILGTPTPEPMMKKVAQNIKSETGGKIDSVIITHEHWDHLSGFTQAKEVFDTITFNEAWLAWTEDPENDLANSLRTTRENRKKAIDTSLKKQKEEFALNSFLTSDQKTARQNYLQAVEELASFRGGLGAAGSASTKSAFDYVKQKAKSIFYYKPGTPPFTPKGIEGIRFYVLGPPEDEKLIKKLLSPKEVYKNAFMSGIGTSFMSAIDGLDEQATDKYLPFDKYRGISTKEPSIFQSMTPSYFESDSAWRKIDNDWIDFSGQLALALDNDTNNTSLVLAVELVDSGKFLLFPGDAQVGNWLSWYNYTWKVKNSAGHEEEMDIKKIFEKTVFYKVGHHGSHNATLSAKGLEMMSNDELFVMIPVNKEMAKKKGWNMPFPTLFKRLKEKSSGRVVVADEDVKNSTKPAGTSPSEWKNLQEMIQQDSASLYFDYEILC